MARTNLVSFLYLSTFSTQGGIERFNRSFIYALCKNSIGPSLFSIYDKEEELDLRYASGSIFYGFNRSRVFTTIVIFFRMLFNRSDVLFVGHLNFAPIVLLLKIIRPQLKMVLIAHGIDVWNQTGFLKKLFIQKVDQIWAVSSFTQEKMMAEYQLPSDKFKLFPNTFDPFIDFSTDISHDLKQRYGIEKGTNVVLTICRISSSESYKGYDRVVKAISLMQTTNLCYVLAGKYDEAEKERVLKIAEEYGVSDRLIFTSFIEEDELISHYKMSDVFIMPSINEGFGIVFLEAIACGISAIGGNLDGSRDALANGKLGVLIDPLSEKQIAEALDTALANQSDGVNLSEEMQKVYGFEAFAKRQRDYLIED